MFKPTVMSVRLRINVSTSVATITIKGHQKLHVSTIQANRCQFKVQKLVLFLYQQELSELFHVVAVLQRWVQCFSVAQMCMRNCKEFKLMIYFFHNCRTYSIFPSSGGIWQTLECGAVITEPRLKWKLWALAAMVRIPKMCGYGYTQLWIIQLCIYKLFCQLVV